MAALWIAIPLILFVPGVIILGLQVWTWRRAAGVERWQTTAGRVVCSEVGVVGGDWQLHPLYRLLRIALILSGRYVAGPRYEPRVAYEYAVEGHPCVGRRLRMGSLATSEADAARIAGDYPVGKVVTVHYNPRRPADAVLEEGLDAANYWIGTVMAVFLVCFGIGVGIWVARGTTSHGGVVDGVAFSPDGARVVSGGADSTVRLWDVRTGEEIWRREVGFYPVTAVAYSPAGDVVASGESGDAIRLWDAATGAPLRTLESPTHTLNALAFSPDGRYLVSASGWDFNDSEPGVALWEVATGTLVRQFTGHRLQVNAVAFSADGKTIATASDDKTARLWDVATGTEVRSLEAEDPVKGIAFSGDGARIAGKLIGDLVVWDIATGKSLATMDAWVYAVAFSPDGTLLASGGRLLSTDNQLTLWDSTTGRIAREFPAQGGEINAVAFDPTGTLVVTGDDENSVRVWEVATGKERRNFRRPMWAP